MTERRTSMNIADYVRGIIDEWSIKMEQVSTITTNNSGNIAGAVKILVKEARQIVSFAHTLNLELRKS